MVAVVLRGEVSGIFHVLVAGEAGVGAQLLLRDQLDRRLAFVSEDLNIQTLNRQSFLRCRTLNFRDPLASTGPRGAEHTPM
jgi:hypothetical protein